MPSLDPTDSTPVSVFLRFLFPPSPSYPRVSLLICCPLCRYIHSSNLSLAPPSTLSYHAFISYSSVPGSIICMYPSLVLHQTYPHPSSPLLAPPFYPLRRQRWIKLCWLIHSHRGYRFLLPRLLLSCVYALTRDSRIIRSFWSFILISSFLLFYYFNKKKIYW